MTPANGSSLIPHPSSLDAALDSLASRRILLFGGKGGVGKTTISAMAASHFAGSLLFTTDPASNLDDLGLPLRVESLDANALWSRFLDANLDAFLEIGDRGTYLDRDELRRFFGLALPGADELMAWMRIGELAETEERVIVDTAPTGHTLRMLSSSSHFVQIGEALDAMQEKHRGLMRQFTRREVRDAMDAFIEDFTTTARRRHALLTDPAQAAFIAVTLSEPWVVEQTKRLLADVDIDKPFVVLNRTAPDCDCARCTAQARRDAEARGEFAKVVEVRRWCRPWP